MIARCRSTRRGLSLARKGTALVDGVLAQGGNDTVRSGDGNDKVCGGKGNDKLFGEKGNDKLLGEDGNDLLDGAPAAMCASGGRGRTS